MSASHLTFYVKLGNTKLRYVLSWGMNVKLEVLFCNSCFELSYDCLVEVDLPHLWWFLVSVRVCACASTLVCGSTHMHTSVLMA